MGDMKARRVERTRGWQARDAAITQQRRGFEPGLSHGRGRGVTAPLKLMSRSSWDMPLGRALPKTPRG